MKCHLTNHDSANMGERVGFDVLTAVVMNCYVSWDITLCSPTFRRNISPASSGSCTAYCLIMKLGATCFSETSVAFQRNTRHYSPECRTLHVSTCFVFLNVLIFCFLPLTTHARPSHPRAMSVCALRRCSTNIHMKLLELDSSRNENQAETDVD
jgi:hypothetical protein